jgi:arylsulfatase A-like enzyme
MSGGLDYFTHRDSAGQHDLFEGEAEAHPTGYLTDLFSERAVDFIERQRGGRTPFLLSVHYTAPHWPWETRADEALARTLEKIAHTDGGSVETYLTMIRHMDEGIGRILDALARTGAAENTLVVFTSDNGGERFSDTWPLVGKKMDLLEGGIRVPYIARWPGRVPAGRITGQLAMTMDWVATFLEAAGVPAHRDYPLDGISLRPVLERPEATIERELFWRMKFRNQRAMRAGSWKYLSLDGDEFLFDLSTDQRERANRGRHETERLAAMRARYAAWEATLPPLPPDAAFAIPYTRADLAQPS